MFPQRGRAVNHAGMNLQECLVVMVFAKGLKKMDAL